jgi:transcriptional regulator with XRE-family HTH domain
MDEDYRLGETIKELRIQNHLTQNQVAQVLGVTPGYVSNVENNRIAMSLHKLAAYAKLVGVSIDYLVGTADENYSANGIDYEILNEVRKLQEKDKVKLLKTIKLWRKK